MISTLFYELQHNQDISAEWYTKRNYKSELWINQTQHWSVHILGYLGTNSAMCEENTEGDSLCTG
eukprot:3760121-Amphidinium_carterae.1